MSVQLLTGDSLNVLKTLPDNSVDAVITDPPYGLSFMNKAWDYDVPKVELWKEVFRVLKPGGHLLSFFGSRTYHRGVVQIEDAGFEIRDQIMWVYGSGFPKSLDISKAIDKAAGAEREVIGEKVRGDVEAAKRNGVTMAAADANKNNKAIFGYGVEKITAPATDDAKQWEGWGTALKPAHEPIVVARKPLSEKTVAKNVLKHGTGALNIDATRVPTEGRPLRELDAKPTDSNVYVGRSGDGGLGKGLDGGSKAVGTTDLGRWPANLIHDGSDEVVDSFPESTSKASPRGDMVDIRGDNFNRADGRRISDSSTVRGHTDSGSAARFFYCSKVSKKERGEGNNHPTVKPVALMAYLCRLVTPKGGTVLDPFMGSGSTGIAAKKEGFKFIGIDLNPDYVEIARKRIGTLPETE